MTAPPRPPIDLLATDLDGTLFPIDDSPEFIEAMKDLRRVIARHHLRVVFVTGRSFEHVLEGIARHDPPLPEAIICDVGTTIMTRNDDAFDRDPFYHQLLRGRLAEWTNDRLCDAAVGLETSIRPQGIEHQSELKCSFYFDATVREAVERRVRDWIDRDSVPVAVTLSIDPFDGRGMLDLLPHQVDKGSALMYWTQRNGVDASRVVFAGDTGNDIGAATIAANVILPANADDQLRAAAANGCGSVFQSRHRCTAGVNDGLNQLLRSAQPEV